MGGKNLEMGALSTLLRGAWEWRSLLMDHGRKEAMETTGPLVSRASQRPTIITQCLRGSSSLSPALPGSGCPLSVPGSLSSAHPKPHSRLPVPGILGLPFLLCLLASVSPTSCVSVCQWCAGLQNHVVHIMLTQPQLQPVASFWWRDLEIFQDCLMCVCMRGVSSQKILGPRKSSSSA